MDRDEDNVVGFVLGGSTHFVAFERDIRPLAVPDHHVLGRDLELVVVGIVTRDAHGVVAAPQSSIRRPPPWRSTRC